MTKARDTSNLVSSVTGIAVTLSGDPVVLGVGNTEHVRVTGSGLVGIGTDDPSARLDVVADISSGYIAEFRQAHASNTGQIVIDSPVDGASRPSYMDYATGGTVKWTTGLAYLDTDRSFHIGTGSGLSNSKVTIKTDGKVGIGTDDPQEDLHIGSNSPYILLDDYDNNYKWKLKGTAWFAIEDETEGVDRFRILSDGKTGIGTDSPSFKLHSGEYSGPNIVGLFETNQLDSFISFKASGTTSNSTVRIGALGNDFVAYINGGYRFCIKSDGGIGINTSSNINGKLTIQADDDDELLFQVRAHNGRTAQLKSTASASNTDPFVFQTNNSWGFDVDTIRTLTLSSDYNVGIGAGADTPSCKLEIVDTATHTAYGSVTPSISDCMLAIANLPTSEAINNHATIQFNVHGGTYNRVCSISAVAESASNRYGALTFCTDDANTRSEKMRITGDGRVLIGGQTTGVKMYLYDSSGANASLYSYHNGTGAYAGLFRCAGGDSTQYACYGYVDTSSSYSSGGILGYSINSSKYAILGYWSTAAYYGLYSNGLIYSSGGFSSSDERLKDVSSRIEGGVLDDLTSLVPVEYTWKDNTEQGRGLEGVTQIGLIAQEVEVNFPHLVMENFHTRITGINSTSLNEEIGMCKSVEYGKLTCYLLVALSEAYDKIKALEQHVGIAST